MWRTLWWQLLLTTVYIAGEHGLNVYIMRGAYGTTKCEFASTDTVRVFRSGKCTGDLGETSNRLTVMDDQVQQEFWENTKCSGDPETIFNTTNATCYNTTVGGVTFAEMISSARPKLTGTFSAIGYYSNTSQCLSNDYGIRFYKRIGACLYDEEFTRRQECNATHMRKFSAAESRKPIPECNKGTQPLVSSVSCVSGGHACLPLLNVTGTSQVSFEGCFNWSSHIDRVTCGFIPTPAPTPSPTNITMNHTNHTTQSSSSSSSSATSQSSSSSSSSSVSTPATSQTATPTGQPTGAVTSTPVPTVYMDPSSSWAVSVSQTITFFFLKTKDVVGDTARVLEVAYALSLGMYDEAQTQYHPGCTLSSTTLSRRAVKVIYEAEVAATHGGVAERGAIRLSQPGGSDIFSAAFLKANAILGTNVKQPVIGEIANATITKQIPPAPPPSDDMLLIAAGGGAGLCAAATCLAGMLFWLWRDTGATEPSSDDKSDDVGTGGSEDGNGGVKVGMEEAPSGVKVSKWKKAAMVSTATAGLGRLRKAGARAASRRLNQRQEQQQQKEPRSPGDEEAVAQPIPRSSKKPFGLTDRTVAALAVMRGTGKKRPKVPPPVARAAQQESQVHQNMAYQGVLTGLESDHVDHFEDASADDMAVGTDEMEVEFASRNREVFQGRTRIPKAEFDRMFADDVTGDLTMTDLES